jgi:hypothetical protein
MRIAEHRLARTSKRGKALHIVEWRHPGTDTLLALCNDGLTLIAEENGNAAHLPLCRLCLKAEEAIRATLVFSDIKVNRMEIGGLTVAQAITEAMRAGVPHTAILTVAGGCSCCADGTAVLEWYTPVESES